MYSLKQWVINALPQTIGNEMYSLKLKIVNVITQTLIEECTPSTSIYSSS